MWARDNCHRSSCARELRPQRDPDVPSPEPDLTVPAAGARDGQGSEWSEGQGSAPSRAVIVAQETLELPLRGVRGTQCIASEEIAYSCRFGENVVSICSTPTTITYRYGPLNRPEIQIASNGVDGRAFQQVGGPKGVRLSKLRFSNAGYDYVVTGLEKDVRISWLAVYRGAGRPLGERECPQGGELQSLNIPGRPSIADEADPFFRGW